MKPGFDSRDPDPSSSPSAREIGFRPGASETPPGFPTSLPRPRPVPRTQRWSLPVLLFGLTVGATYWTGGLSYAIPIMLTLLCHELGHYLQARRHRVPVSPPYFIPMPFTLFGTLGAVIAMKPGQGDRKELFDIAITGPIAGLIPAIAFSAIGLSLSEVQLVDEAERRLTLGEPLLFQWLAHWVCGAREAGEDIVLHPLGFAGWVGLFVTGLNLVPIGQLDGGHVLYALLRRKSHPVAMLLLGAALAAVVWTRTWEWTLMIFLLVMTGARHPPTANDQVELGTGRVVLGIAMLLFVIVSFTPRPLLGTGL